MNKFDDKLKRMVACDVTGVSRVIWGIENDDRYTKLIKYISSSEHMRNYYSSIDIENRKKELLEIITDITSALANEHDFRKNIKVLRGCIKCQNFNIFHLLKGKIWYNITNSSNGIIKNYSKNNK